MTIFLINLFKPTISVGEVIILFSGSWIIYKIFESSIYQLISLIFFSLFCSFLSHIFSFKNMLILCSFLPKKIKNHMVSWFFWIYTGYKVVVTKFEYK